MRKYVCIDGHQLTPTQLRTLCEVSAAGGRVGHPVRVSLARISRVCGVREGAARNAVHALCSKGLVLAEPVYGSDGGQRANEYAITKSGARVLTQLREQAATDAELAAASRPVPRPAPVAEPEFATWPSANSHPEPVEQLTAEFETAPQAATGNPSHASLRLVSNRTTVTRSHTHSETRLGPQPGAPPGAPPGALPEAAGEEPPGTPPGAPPGAPPGELPGKEPHLVATS